MGQDKMDQGKGGEKGGERGGEKGGEKGDEKGWENGTPRATKIWYFHVLGRALVLNQF